MKAVSGKEFAKVLERHGWQLMRIKGSHHIYEEPEAKFESPFLSTAINLSKQDCCDTSSRPPD